MSHWKYPKGRVTKKKMVVFVTLKISQGKGYKKEKAGGQSTKGEHGMKIRGRKRKNFKRRTGSQEGLRCFTLCSWHSNWRAGEKNERGWSPKPPGQENSLRNRIEGWSLFRKSNPWSQESCGRVDCFPCKGVGGGAVAGGKGCLRHNLPRMWRWGVYLLPILERQEGMPTQEEKSTLKRCHRKIWTIPSCGCTLSITTKGRRRWTTPWRWWGATTSPWIGKWRKCKYRTWRGQSWWTEEMRWEVSEWRGPNIEDGVAIHNAQQQHQWRISLKNIKGRRGLERVWRRSESLCNNPQAAEVVTNPSINILEGVDAHHLNLLIRARRCPCSAGVGLDTICCEETRRPRFL